MIKTPKKILHTLPSGGSDYGLSYYTKWLGCPRRAALDEEDNNQIPMQQTNSAAAVGIIGHALLEMHFSRALGQDADPAIAVQYSDAVDETARCEAERLFRAFRSKFPHPEYFGKVIAVEEEIIGDDNICKAVGIDPFTCRIDLVTKLGVAQIKRLKKAYPALENNPHLVPGYWIIDHKHYRSRTKTLELQANVSPQYVAYPLAWSVRYPKKVVKGTLQNTIYKLVEPKFDLFVIPFPDSYKVTALHAMFHRITHIIKEHRHFCNPKECFSWNKPCRWLDLGVCKRY